MGMDVRVSNDFQSVVAQLNQATERGQDAFINQVYADMTPYVPRLGGDLRSQSHIAPDKKSIVYNSPYATRLYYNQFVNYSTPGTGPRWDEVAKANHMESWKRVIERAMRL